MQCGEYIGNDNNGVECTSSVQYKEPAKSILSLAQYRARSLQLSFDSPAPPNKGNSRFRDHPAPAGAPTAQLLTVTIRKST
ncbi:hypothetical protein EVAR_48677_1 [Eumeta japonica]|uniref:Uncharacterized protein n=1 Tax=Eumeta variegata TaxID=151549 RepID=A0A4C1X7E5_EUMVA|nr:hypothetical protein EVAR_48677_1 [Eumeta japonica]